MIVVVLGLVIGSTEELLLVQQHSQHDRKVDCILAKQV